VKSKKDYIKAEYYPDQKRPIQIRHVGHLVIDLSSRERFQATSGPQGISGRAISVTPVCDESQRIRSFVQIGRHGAGLPVRLRNSAAEGSRFLREAGDENYPTACKQNEARAYQDEELDALQMIEQFPLDEGSHGVTSHLS
jgi:hypothetical protein